MSAYTKAKSRIKPLIPKKLFAKTVNGYHLFEAGVANTRNGWPARKMKFIGVTGTNGKTSTTVMIAAIMEEAGFKIGMSTTALVNDGKKVFQNNLDGGLTSAGTFTMQKLLARMHENGVEWVIMEAASQALTQHRLYGVTFEASVITNLTTEHLDYHGTMERYAAAKARLFKKTRRTAVINADDQWADYFANQGVRNTVRYGRKAKDYRLEATEHRAKTTRVRFTHNGQEYEYKLLVQGEFNAYNSLAAVAITHEVGVPFETAFAALAKLERIPGRMDALQAGQPFRVLVDYAHTPDAIKNVLEAAREITTGRLICVTGAAGDRPLSRRAPVGKFANELSDILIVTDDEPGSEDPEIIRRQILEGVKKGRDTAEVHEIPDRWDAIKYAFEQAKKGDTVLIAGIGHQKYRNGPNGKETWNDGAVAEAILKGKSSTANDNWRRVIREAWGEKKA